MGEKSIFTFLLGALLVSLVCTPAAYAIGAWSTLADAIWDHEGDQAGARSGEAVTATGDFNGDSYDDVVIGARLYDYFDGVTTWDDNGGAWVFYGSATGPSTVPDLFLAPPFKNDYGYFGFAVATANLDGDDYDDLIISLPNYDQTHSDEGAVYVYYGSASGIDGTPDWTVRGANTYAHLGLSAASAGDIDNDGYDDLIIGAKRYDTCSPFINHAYVFLGSVTGLGGDATAAEADWYATGDQCDPGIPFPNDKTAAFGTHVGSAGDLNDDSYDDIFITAPLYDAGQANEGKVFVWYGAMSGLGATGSPSNADWTAEGDRADLQFGGDSMPAVASGDLNGDSYDDLVIGSRLYDHQATNDGVVLVWYGSDTGLGTNGVPSNADWLAYGAEGDQLGSNVRVLDYNGDRFDDVLAGGLGHTVGSNGAAGMAVIWLGTEDGLNGGGPSDYADWMVEGDQATSYLGWSMSAGDTDDDGYEDMIIGAPYYDLATTDKGKVWAFPGEPTVFIENFETGDTDRCSYTVE